METNRKEGAGKAERAVVVGGGLVGPLLATCLARRGYDVEIYDKNDDPRRIDISASRSSINLSLSERGLVALSRFGLDELVRSRIVPTGGRLIHLKDGNSVYQSYGKNGEASYSVMRNELSQTLLDAAQERFGVRCHFNERCVDVDIDAPKLSFENTKTGVAHQVSADRIFGADGAFSAVRYRLQRVKRFNFSQQFLDHGYTELNIPAGRAGSWTEQVNSVHLWPRGDYMLLGLPNPDGSIVCSLHLRLEGEPSFESLSSEEALVSFFAESFPDVVSEIPDLARSFFANPVNHFVSVRCYPWSYQDKVALIGDAAHAVFPFYAQGTNAGFEDCVVLDECLEEYGDDWSAVLDQYQKRRKKNADAISDMSREHYQELRDQVGDPSFQVRKKIEERLAAIDADRFMSLYTMVTFTCIPYAEARSRGQKLRAIVDHLMAHGDIDTKSDTEILELVDGVSA